MPSMSNATFEEVLDRDGKLIYTNVGDSMMPLIKQGRDLLVIEKAGGRLRKYDIPLYRRDSGQYVLHRILKVRKDDYVMCGDNRWGKEYGITDRHIIGKLTAIITDGKERPLSGFKYRMYLFFRCTLYPVRAAALLVRDVLKRIIYKVGFGG